MAEGAGGKRTKVLVVEDDTASAVALLRLLRDDGFEAELSADGNSAVTRVQSGHAIDCVIVDFRVPGVDGLVVARAAAERVPPIPVIFVTGYPDLVRRYFTVRASRAEIFGKPLNYNELALAIRRITGANKLRSAS